VNYTVIVKIIHTGLERNPCQMSRRIWRQNWHVDGGKPISFRAVLRCPLDFKWSLRLSLHKSQNKSKGLRNSWMQREPAVRCALLNCTWYGSPVARTIWHMCNHCFSYFQTSSQSFGKREEFSIHKRRKKNYKLYLICTTKRTRTPFLFIR
jgi:hypothetical protein